MAIDFSLLTGGGAGLPDFTGGVLAAKEKEQERQAQMAMFQQQLAAQQQASMPTELDYRKDAREQAMADAKLAREQQALGLDLNADNRAERGLLSEIELRSKQTEQVENNIKLDWSKFNVDKDIKYQGLKMDKEMQSFNMDQMKTKLGYEIKWGENQDDREERKFGFEVNKYRQQKAQEEDFKNTLANARKQGTEALYNTLIDNGMFNEAQTFVTTNEKLEAMSGAEQDKKQAKQQQIVFAQVAPKIMQGQELNQKEAMMLTDVLYGEEFTNNLLGTGQLQQVAKIGALSAFDKQFVNLAGDPLATAQIASKITGVKVNVPQTPEDIKEYNKLVGGVFDQADSARKIQKKLIEAEEASKAFALAGIGSKGFQGYIGDTADALAVIARSAGIEIKSASDFGRAQAILQGKLLDIQKDLGTVMDKDGNAVINARTAKLFEDVNTFGSDELRGLRESMDLSTSIKSADYLQEILKENPGIGHIELRTKIFNKQKDFYESRQESSNPKDQSAKFRRLQELRAKAGK
jgi:hypothetical protein